MSCNHIGSRHFVGGSVIWCRNCGALSVKDGDWTLSEQEQARRQAGWRWENLPSTVASPLFVGAARVLSDDSPAVRGYRAQIVVNRRLLVLDQDLRDVLNRERQFAERLLVLPGMVIDFRVQDGHERDPYRTPAHKVDGEFEKQWLVRDASPADCVDFMIHSSPATLPFNVLACEPGTRRFLEQVMGRSKQ